MGGLNRISSVAMANIHSVVLHLERNSRPQYPPMTGSKVPIGMPECFQDRINQMCRRMLNSIVLRSRASGTGVSPLTLIRGPWIS
jgi:hypothetical protein